MRTSAAARRVTSYIRHIAEDHESQGIYTSCIELGILPKIIESSEAIRQVAIYLRHTAEDHEKCRSTPYKSNSRYELLGKCNPTAFTCLIKANYPMHQIRLLVGDQWTVTQRKD